MRQRILGGTRGQILELIWRGRQTVDEIATALGLTANAVRTHLVALERDGLVRQVGHRPGRRKPSLLYNCTSAAEQLLPKPYAPVLEAVLDEVESRHGEDEVRAVLERTGERLASVYQPRAQGRNFQERLREVTKLLNELGGIADVEECDGSYRIRGFNCPIAQIVASRPHACVVAHTLIATLLPDAEVRKQCQRNGAARCAFEVTPPAR